MCENRYLRRYRTSSICSNNLLVGLRSNKRGLSDDEIQNKKLTYVLFEKSVTEYHSSATASTRQINRLDYLPYLLLSISLSELIPRIHSSLVTSVSRAQYFFLLKIHLKASLYWRPTNLTHCGHINNNNNLCNDQISHK